MANVECESTPTPYFLAFERINKKIPMTNPEIKMLAQSGYNNFNHSFFYGL